ncbi:MAG: isoleucine--tRNA ligase [Candidatus Aenigmarchaeota archaeon]|nr:isoleucine--tRNA ligase [Candidatus Aenigmarchaeota archaeon]
MATYNPQEIEKKILKLWEDEKLVEKSLDLRKGNKTFSFMDGPPTANNPMGVHHAWGRTYKDLFLRLKTMQGFDTRKQPGFDCQGLWVEVGVEKELGFKTKKDIEKYGIGKFTEKCVENVLNYVKIWINLSKKLGMWMDWDNPYLTLSDTNIEYVWYFLKKCHEKGWLYKGMKVLPWCPRCGTSLSSHEVSSGYKEKTHPAIYVKFQIKDREDEYLLIYTTTPWTLVSNVAVAANPNEEYVKVKVNDEKFILGKNLLKSIFPDKNYRILETFYGRELVELQYDNPMKDLLPIQWNISGKIILSEEFVSLEEGTGLVHIAPGHGPEDYQLGLEYKLPILSPIDEDGKFTEDAGWLKGKGAKEASELVLEKLRERNILYKETTLTHSYPCCWRCDEELIYRTGEEWFIASEEIKPNLIKEIEKVIFYPEWTKKSMLDWLRNLKDWNISRKRYYGLPLPFWVCDCGGLEIIGSKKELKKKAVKGFNQLKELHRPWIDNIILKCKKCGKEMKRIEETGDCWLDAGVVFFSTLNYFDDKRYWKKWFPADFITEMHEQVRLWFYATLFVSVTLKNKTPYKSVLAHGMVLDEKFKEMHKSTGNVIWADEALEKMGADVMRWMYCKQNPGQPMPFGYTPAKEVRRILNILFNTVKFLQTYCEANGFKLTKPKKIDISSKWLLSRVQTLKQEVTKDLDELKPHLASNKLEEFFLNDLSRWYGHIIREDIKPGIKSKNKQSMLYTFYTVILDTLKLLSVFIPFITEDLYQDFFKSFEKEGSIHFSDWPKIEKKLIDKKLEEEMDIVKKIVELSNATRHEKGIKLKYPLKSLTVKSKKKVKRLEDIVKKMANVKEVKFEASEKELEVILDTEITQELKDEWLLSELTRNVQAFRKKLGLKIKDKVTLYLPEEELFKKSKDIIEGITGSEIIFGKIEGNKSEFKFENKKYEFGIKN